MTKYHGSNQYGGILVTSDEEEGYYTSLEEFFASLDGLIGPIVGLAQLKEEHREELKEIGVLHDSPPPKWVRRKRGERRPSDRYDYGER